MFEQTFVDGVGKTNKSWTVTVSFIVQMGIIGVLVILPLIFTDVLPKAQLVSLLQAPAPPPPPPPPPPPTPVKIIKVPPRQFDAGKLMAPKSIPKDIAIIREEELPPSAINQQVIGIRGVESQRVIVGVHLPTRHRQRLSSVLGEVDRHVHGVHAIELKRVGEDLSVILGVLHDVIAHLRPVAATVFRPIESALVGAARGRDSGIDHIRLLRRDRQRDPSLVHGRQSFTQLAPMLASVGRFVNRRFGSAR